MATIFVDADACPVREEIATIALRHALPAVFVANGGIRPFREEGLSVVTVSGAFDAADDWIVEQAAPGDIAVTADIALAARLVPAGVTVLAPDGKAFDAANIGMAMAMRELNRDLRESGAISGHNRSFTPRDRSAFRAALDRAARRVAAGGAPAARPTP